MFNSHKNKKILSLVVGIVGLVTIVGLSDLMFVLPRQQDPEPEAVPSETQAAGEAPYATTTASTTANQ